MLRLTALALLLAAPPARAIDHEELNVLGWKFGACSVAIAHFGYPSLGEAPVDTPDFVRVGALTLEPGQNAPKEKWSVTSEGAYAYYADETEQAVATLKTAFAQPGYAETIRPEPAGAQPGLDEVLRSTAAFSTGPVKSWPKPPYRLSAVHYSPISTCALLVYRDQKAKKDFFDYVLARVGNPRARIVRARAHVENALLLLNSGDIEAALAETATAAAMAPENALSRYHHAMLLSLSGYIPEALDELEETIKIDPKYKDKLRGEKNFDNLFGEKRFKKLAKPNSGD